MRKLNELRKQLLDVEEAYDVEALSEVTKFLEKYPSDTAYKIYFVTYDERRILYDDVGIMQHDELPQIVAMNFVYATTNLKFIPKTPHPDRVELEYNFGQRLVQYELLGHRIHYYIDGQLYGYQT